MAQEEEAHVPKADEDGPKAEQAAAEEPAVKEEQKIEGEPKELAEKEKPEEPEKAKEPEKPSELEEDDSADERARLISGEVRVSAVDTTLNVLPVADGDFLTALSDGGCQYLLAGARATVGVKAGRYLFEVRIVECHNPTELRGSQAAAPEPRQLVRVGFSCAGSHLFLGEGEENICFDSEGGFTFNRKRTVLHMRDQKDQRDKGSAGFAASGRVAAVLLNLDEKLPNAGTVSLFLDGKRASEPQPLPEALKGTVLYPTVTYRNASIQVNFGPAPIRPLPFACRMLADAAKADVEVALPPAEGPKEVVLPVALPDEGAFDSIDEFLKANPYHAEISERMLLQWAELSGLRRNKGFDWRHSNDRPEMSLGLAPLDDLSVLRVLSLVAPLLGRSFVVAEVRGNLLAEERKKVLARFPGFKKVALVAMGEPPAEHKASVQELILAGKRQKIIEDKKNKHLEVERKRLVAEREKKEKEFWEAKRQKTEKAAEGEEEKKEDEKPAEEKEKEVEEEKAANEEEEEEEEKPVELSEEEKKIFFRPSKQPDVTPRAMASAFASFSIPEQQEGFDEVKFIWHKQDDSNAYLTKWISDRKKIQRVEDLQPGDWFKEQWGAWSKLLRGWKDTQTAFKKNGKRPPPKKNEKKEEKNGEEVHGEDKKDEEEEPMQISAEEVDVFGVEDIMDIGNGEPIFANFAYEDWSLLSLRFELHLLVHSFRKDLNDPERPTFHERHATFYYKKYFSNAITYKNYNVEDLEGLTNLITGAVGIDHQKMLKSALSDDTPMDNFVKLTEEARRERERRMDAGDETARLKFVRPAPPPSSREPPAPPRGGDRGYNGHGDRGHTSHGDRGHTSQGDRVHTSHGDRGSGQGDRGHSTQGRQGDRGISSQGGRQRSPPAPRRGYDPPSRNRAPSRPRSRGEKRGHSGSRRYGSSYNEPPPKHSRTSDDARTRTSHGGGGSGYSSRNGDRRR